VTRRGTNIVSNRAETAISFPEADLRKAELSLI
jgi:hypothetical protein